MAKKKKPTETDEGGGVATAEAPAEKTTITVSEAVQTSARPVAAGRYEPALALELLSVSPSNPRKHFDPAAITALAKDLASNGQIHPILVRPVDVTLAPDGETIDQVHAYEIVVGECRYRAAKEAGLPALMATVRELSDVDVLKIQLAENAKRQDITPLEEAAAYQDLMKKAGWDAKQLAADQKVSVRQVYARLTLLDLPKEVQAALDAGRITAAHAEIISRLPKGVLQRDALNYAFLNEGYGPQAVYGIVPIRVFENLIKTELLQELSAAPWDLDDAELHPKAGACSVCPLRSLAAEPLLSEQEKDCCLNSECWRAKAQAFLEQRVDSLKKEGDVLLLARDRYNLPRAFSQAEEANLYREVKETHKDARKAIYVDGPLVGQIRHVVYDRDEIKERAEYDSGARKLLKEIDSETQKSRDGDGGSKAEAAPAKKPLKERVAQLESRRGGNVVDALRDKILPKFSAAEFIKLHGELWLFHLNALACSFGVSNSLGDVYGGKGWTTFKKLCEGSGTKLAAYEPLGEKLWPAVRSQIIQALQYQTLSDIKIENVKATIDLLGLKWEDLHAKACDAIPTPKSILEEMGDKVVENEKAATEEKISAKQIKKDAAAAKKGKTPKAKAAGKKKAKKK